MLLSLDKTYGPALVNLLRQISMTAYPVVRPIAFSVGSDSNVIDTADTAVEDMVAFIDNVMNPNYYTANDDIAELVDFKATVTTALSSDQFEQVGIISKQNKVVLNVLAPTPVSIIFRKASGRYTAKQNVEFLRKNNVDTDKYVVVPSRHCAVDSFLINEIEDENEYKVDISIISQISSDNAILTQGLEVMEKQVQELRQKLLNS